MQARAEIIASGEVQRVGYRDVVERAARKLKLTGFVENVKPYDVRIVVEGEDGALEQFIEKSQIRKPPIRVERVEAQFESATGEFPYFAIKRGEMAEELGERLDIANARMTGMIEKQDVMIEKQDVMTEKQDVMIGKQDVMIEKLDANTALLKENTDTLKGFRSESNANFELLHQDNRALNEGADGPARAHH